VDHDFQRIADLEEFWIDCERELAEGKNALRLAADIDEQFVLILRDDDSV